jgi:hypothetical protein
MSGSCLARMLAQFSSRNLSTGPRIRNMGDVDVFITGTGTSYAAGGLAGTQACEAGTACIGTMLSFTSSGCWYCVDFL